MPMHRTVRAVNELTVRWAERSGVGRGTVFSAPGAWAPLAFLASGAHGPAAAELADALGVPPADAGPAGRELLDALGRTGGVGAALGVWARDRLPVEPDWAAELPPGTFGTFGDDLVKAQSEMDSWADERTGGLIRRMPARIDTETELLLAGALTVRTDWIRRFGSWTGRPDSGAWQDREVTQLFRTTALLDRVGVARTAAGPLTVLHVLGKQGVDVHLCLGAQDADPGRVLAAAVRTAERPSALRPGRLLEQGEPGPGLHVGPLRSYRPEHRLQVETVQFDLDAEHDLLAHADLFGLRTAADTGRGHFPGISAEPLAVGAAAQSANAVFGPRGFRAAAVTALSGAAGGANLRQPPYRIRQIDARFDRPFAFLAVHRTSRLVLAAGWVAEPSAGTGPVPPVRPLTGHQETNSLG